MKLVRFGPPGRELPGLLDAAGNVRDLSGQVADIDPSLFITNAVPRLRSLDGATLPLVQGTPRLGPCIANVGKIICVGLNYSDHAAETGMAIPSEPVLFFKATTAINGPNDDVRLPRGSRKMDWEVELAVVIGKTARYVSESDAADCIGGFCVINDLSEREFQLERGGQWVKGKSCDTFAPLGPWLVTPDEVADPHALRMTLAVNGRRYQQGSTATMVYRVPFLISYISQFMTLSVGDIISTGTPPGVGMGQNPPVYLREGDVMELEIEGLGCQRQTVVGYEA
jgi:2-keto-4-pentenoate hydratase/2-oxohepta-3-ene-1,7-dioic acid hydratase in catechol pathway